MASLPMETEEGEVRFDQSGAEGIDIRAFWARSRSIRHRGFFNRAFGHAKFCARDNREFACGRVRQLREGQQSEENETAGVNGSPFLHFGSGVSLPGVACLARNRSG